MGMPKRATKVEPRRFTRGPSCDLDENGDPVPRDRSDETPPVPSELLGPRRPQGGVVDWDPEDAV